MNLTIRSEIASHHEDANIFFAKILVYMESKYKGKIMRQMPLKDNRKTCIVVCMGSSKKPYIYGLFYSFIVEDCGYATTIFCCNDAELLKELEELED